jgi:hypothetical protein
MSEGYRLSRENGNPGLNLNWRHLRNGRCRCSTIAIIELNGDQAGTQVLTLVRWVSLEQWL